jgi:hypothetical protein
MAFSQRRADMGYKKRMSKRTCNFLEHLGVDDADRKGEKSK